MGRQACFYTLVQEKKIIIFPSAVESENGLIFDLDVKSAIHDTGCAPKSMR